VSENLSREQELGYLSCTRVTDFIVRKIKLTNGFVKYKTLNQNTDQIIINQISWEAQVHQRLGDFHALRENFGIGHFHTE